MADIKYVLPYTYAYKLNILSFTFTLFYLNRIIFGGFCYIIGVMLYTDDPMFLRLVIWFYLDYSLCMLLLPGSSLFIPVLF